MSAAVHARSLYDLPWLYDALCPPLRADDPELRWFRDVCAGAGSVLELGAGTGRLAIPLARAGPSVTALEPSEAMREVGAARARRAGVDVRWVPGDMRDYTLIDQDGQGARFDRILVAYNALLHLHTRDDHRRFFERARAHLSPAGRLVISIVSPDPETLGRRPHHRLRLHDHEIVDPRTGLRLVVEETVRWDHAAQCTRGHFHVSEPTGPDLLVVPVDLRMIFPQELLLLLAHEGFEVVRHDGDFEGRPFGPRSLWQNVVCAPTR